MELDRKTIVAVLVAHQRKGIGGCQCGWNELGMSHCEHVADALQAESKITLPGERLP